jgi:hypothetical protein
MFFSLSSAIVMSTYGVLFEWKELGAPHALGNWVANLARRSKQPLGWEPGLERGRPDELT